MPKRSKKHEASPAEPEAESPGTEAQERAAGLSQEADPGVKPDATPNIMDNLAALDARIDEVAEEAAGKVAGLSRKVASLEERMDMLESAEEEPEEEKQPRALRSDEYEVREGEVSLALLAKRLLGNAGRFSEIVALNQGRYPSLVTDPNHVEAGWVLVIP